MKRLYGILMILALTACGTVPAPATAQLPAADPDERAIHVDATALVQRTPDRAVISLAVETVATAAVDATRQNAQVMEQVLAAIRALGIPDRNIQTRRVDLQPRYDRARDQQEPRITGYVARNQVMVTTDDVATVGRIVDAGVEAGANRVSGISFELQDPEAAHHEALQLAIRKARREAEVAAEAVGETLGPVLSLRTSAFYPVARMAPAPQPEMVRMDAASTPVEPGELDVQATVSITFRIGT